MQQAFPQRHEVRDDWGLWCLERDLSLIRRFPDQYPQPVGTFWNPFKAIFKVL
jgi:hypothetical protein